MSVLTDIKENTFKTHYTCYLLLLIISVYYIGNSEPIKF